MDKFKSVFKFEYLGCIKGKAYIITTIIFIIFGVVLTCIPTVIGAIEGGLGGDKDDKAEHMAVYFQDGKNSMDRLPKDLIESNQYVVVTNVEEGKEGVLNEEYTSLAIIDFENNSSNVFVKTLGAASKKYSSQSRNVYQRVYGEEYLTEKGLTEEDALNITKEPMEGVSSLDGGSIEGYLKNYAYAYVMVFMLYMSILMYNQFVIVSIISEKSSRTIEILVTSVKPKILMFGKVLGSGMAGLTQFVCIGAITYVAYKINSIFWGNESFGVTAKELSTPTTPLIFVYFIIFFVLGYLFYSFIYAGLASTVSRMEEASSIMTLPALLIVSSLIVSMISLSSPDNIVGVVFSYIPFSSSMVMFSRFCIGAASSIEVLISMLLLLISTIGLGFLSSKLYRMGLLMYGKPPKFKEIFKMLVSTKS